MSDKKKAHPVLVANIDVTGRVPHICTQQRGEGGRKKTGSRHRPMDVLRFSCDVRDQIWVDSR